MSNPGTHQDFFPFAVHIIYAILITFTFEAAREIFVPFETVFSSDNNIVNGLALASVYFVMIAGWLNYSLATNKRPHTPDIRGLTRFAIDLIIMTILFYLVSITSSDVFTEAYWHAFIWVYPLLFLLYVFWDRIELKEYGDDPAQRVIIEAQITKSINGFLLMVYQAFVYAMTAIFLPLVFPITVNTMYTFFTVTTLGIILYYRLNKVDILPKKKIPRQKD